MENDPLKNPDPTSVNFQKPSTSIFPKKYLVLMIGLLLIFIASSVYFFVRKDFLPLSRKNPSISLAPSMNTTQTSGDLSKLPPDILASKLYYQQDNIVYERAPLNSNPKVFLNAESYEFSPDFTKIAYI